MKINKKKLDQFKHQKKQLKKKIKLKQNKYKKLLIWILDYNKFNNNQDKWILINLNLIMNQIYT